MGRIRDGEGMLSGDGEIRLLFFFGGVFIFFFGIFYYFRIFSVYLEYLEYVGCLLSCIECFFFDFVF